MAQKTAIYPGSFDPVTKGHLDIIERAAKLFDKLIVAIGENLEKEPLLDVEERISLLKQEVTRLPNVEVDRFSSLLIDYAKKRNCSIVIRSLRAMSDFDREFQMAIANTELYPKLETLFLMTDKKYFYLSSSLLKELCKHKGDISGYVSPAVAGLLRDKLA